MHSYYLNSLLWVLTRVLGLSQSTVQDAAFDPVASSTSGIVSCGNEKCVCGRPACSCSTDNLCMYSRTYGESPSLCYLTEKPHWFNRIQLFGQASVLASVMAARIALLHHSVEIANCHP